MKLKHIITIAALGLVLPACKKSLLDINTNPNQLPTSTPDYLFTAAANRTVAASLDPHELGSYWSGLWTYSNTYIISTTIFSYQFNNTNFNYWDGWYDIMNDYQFVINTADEKGQPFMKGPAKIMKAYVMQQVLDCYGDAPYSEALQGTSKLAPKLDDQKAVYEELIKLLDEGIADVKANSFNSAGTAADIVWKGNVTNWVRFANSLKLRILIRQSRIPGRDAYITTEINKAAATAEGFLAAGQDAGVNPGYVASAGKMNPYYERWGYNSAGGAQALARLPRPTKFLFDVMKAADDTFRLKRLAYARGGEDANNPGVSKVPEIISNYVGVPYGISSGYAAPATSYPGPAVIVRNQFNRPMYIMTAAESFFLQAEAKQRYGAAVTLPSTAQAYYEQGVRESFRLTGTASSAATTLLTSGKDLADWNASANKLQAIWMQKWIALANFNGLEAWSEFRRTNFPNIPASASAPVGQPLPVRLFYPQSETGSNPNIPQQAPTEVFNTRLFWDVD